MKINFKYRTWWKGIAPKKIKLETPGWAGEKSKTAQPWHCKPFIDASTYGFELIYPFKTEVEVTSKNGECFFNGDFEANEEHHDFYSNTPSKKPFANFAKNHFGFTSSLDIQTDEGFGTMILPHPRFYTDRTGTVPCPVSGFLETDFWPRIFFVVFKAPLEGEKYVFRYGEPYAQILILPKSVDYNYREMTNKEESYRNKIDNVINQCAKKIATKFWKDSNNYDFDNKYKVLSNMAKKIGVDNLYKRLEEIQNDSHVEEQTFQNIRESKFKRRLVTTQRQKYDN